MKYKDSRETAQDSRGIAFCETAQDSRGTARKRRKD